MAASMRAFGASEESIEAAARELGATAVSVDLDYAVHADCWESVLFFQAVETQWVWVGVGIPTPLGAVIKPVRSGLNRACVEAEMRMRGIKRKDQAALLDDLRVMEAAVLEASAEAAGEQQ